MALEERTLHIVTEALAIPVGFYLIWLGNTKLKGFNKYAVIVIGLGNLIIDGYMLTTW